ncbi:unnamed protein product [Bursaphelenchus xylophilus]|uniref:(pine wood nematode) hypothetical protein n=1 Tax=Bursaphelenchus xylophilus TaxID=6326 RepID=A0A1I7RYT8_BURXY|nr:unnamed protein product [Bursaphelenchus xylophilus]CAG9092238.1 unnamed protein product [Bursaphelenchus xylophilus]
MAAVEPSSGGDASLTKTVADAIIQDRAAQKAEEIEGRPAASSPIQKRGRPPRKFNPRRLPDRWEAYSPCGKVIADTRLIAFKTPLKPDFFQGTELEPFGIDDLVEAMEKQNQKLGLVIDLTATTRYYDPAELEQYGIKYKKIFCPGRDFEALKDLGDEFMDTIKEYFMENLDNNSLIGIHCTHGLNRTGYLVCRYMHECLGWSVDESVNTFNAARGHEIERKEYITALQLKCEYHNGSYRC